MNAQILRCTIGLALFSWGCQPSARGEDFLEIITEMASTFENPARTNVNKVAVTCVVGTNEWYIAGDFSENARIEYWLVGTNIAERTTITSGMYLERAKELFSEKVLGRKNYRPLAGGYPRKGETYVRVQSWQESFGGSDDSLAWLAFCSGEYLAIPGRKIPIPIGFSSREAESSDKTTLLDGGSGVPKKLQLYASSGQLICDYEVLRTTNILGRTYPLEFRFFQHGFASDNGVNDIATSKFIVRGKVTSLRAVKREPIPDEVMRALESVPRSAK